MDNDNMPAAAQEAVAWLSKDDAQLALFKAIKAIKLGNQTDDKLILANLREAGLWIGRYEAAPVAAAPVVDVRLANWIIAAVGDIPYSTMTSEQVIAALEENRRVYEGNEGCGTHYRASPKGGSDVPDMFWNDADPERAFDSIIELVSQEWSNGSVVAGDVMEIQQATRLPNIKVRIVESEDDGVDYEQLKATSHGAGEQ